MNYIKPYIILNLLTWLPWGLICIFNLSLIDSIIGVSSIVPHGQSDIRAMYGGVQTGMGFMAVFALLNTRYFSHFVFALAFIAGGLAISRSIGLVLDSSYGMYTIGVLSYEYFAAISAIAWLRVLPKLYEKS